MGGERGGEMACYIVPTQFFLRDSMRERFILTPIYMEAKLEDRRN